MSKTFDIIKFSLIFILSLRKLSFIIFMKEYNVDYCSTKDLFKNVSIMKYRATDIFSDLKVKIVGSLM